MKCDIVKLEYLDFEIEISPGIGLEYPVAVIRSPGGEAKSIFRFPFDELALESRLKDLQIALLRSGGLRRIALTEQEKTVQEFGQVLFDSLICGEIRSRFDISQREAEIRGKGLRTKLHIQAPELSRLPWEFLFDARKGEYICLSTQTPIVRYINVPQIIQPLAINPPLRILGMTASPRGLDELDVENEKRRVETALQDLKTKGQVQLTWMDHTTWHVLQQVMRKGGPYHILHFIGHGGFDRNVDEGIIALEDEVGDLHRLGARQLALLLTDHTSLRLVILNSCESARSGIKDIFSSTASILVQRRLPAVLAMQYEITDRAAIEFARGFYEAITDGFPVDAATAEGRKSVCLGVSNTIEWGTPVLFMRAPDGVLFRPETPAEKAARREVERSQREQTRREIEANKARLAADRQAREKAEREQAEREKQEKAVFKKLSDIPPLSRKKQFAALQIQMQSQKPSDILKGMEQIHRWLQENPDDQDVYAVLLNIVQENHDLREQVRSFLIELMQKGSKAAERALSVLPSSVKDLLANADDAYYAAEFEKAVQLYRQVLKLDPENVRAQDHLAKAKSAQSNKGEERTGMPRTAIQYFRQARSFLAARDFLTAMKLLNAALEAAQAKGVSYPEAENLLDDVQDLLVADEFKERAKVAIEKEQWDAALDLYSKAASLDPTNVVMKKELESIQHLLRLELELQKRGAFKIFLPLSSLQFALTSAKDVLSPENSLLHLLEKQLSQIRMMRFAMAITFALMAIIFILFPVLSNLP